MKIKIIIFFVFNFFLSKSFAQAIPIDIQEILNRLKGESKIALDDYRINSGKGELHSGLLMYYFSYPPSIQQKVDSLNLKLNLGMIYDEEMRVRIVQLMNNKFNEAELDTLVNMHLLNDNEYYYKKAFEICKFDTMLFYKNKLDSFYADFKSKNIKNAKFEYMYKTYFFSSINLDTTKEFKKIYKDIIKEDSIIIRNDCRFSRNYNYTYLAELCGYINDKRFIKPLISALKKPNNFDSVSVIEALVRMKVEPYYSRYINQHKLNLKDIKTGKPHDEYLYELTEVLRTQESFLEFSKALFSSKPGILIASEKGTNAAFFKCQFVYSTIKDNILNDDLQAIANERSILNEDMKKSEKLRMDVYNWMQKNYGKYKIKRIW